MTFFSFFLSNRGPRKPIWEICCYWPPGLLGSARTGLMTWVKTFRVLKLSQPTCSFKTRWWEHCTVSFFKQNESDTGCFLIIILKNWHFFTSCIKVENFWILFFFLQITECLWPLWPFNLLAGRDQCQRQICAKPAVYISSRWGGATLVSWKMNKASRYILLSSQLSWRDNRKSVCSVTECKGCRKRLRIAENTCGKRNLPYGEAGSLGGLQPFTCIKNLQCQQPVRRPTYAAKVKTSPTT